MDHDDNFEHTWKIQADEQLDYVEKNVFSTDFIYARFLRGTENTTGPAIKSCSILSSLSWKCFNCLRNGCDEPIYTCKNDKRWLVGQSKKRGRCTPFNQLCEFKISETFSGTVSEKLNVKKFFSEVIGAYFDYMSEKMRKKTILILMIIVRLMTEKKAVL